jgi:cytochrome c2
VVLQLALETISGRRNSRTRRAALRARRAAALALFLSAPTGGFAADAESGKRIFATICHQCHAALPYTGRIGVENLPKFLANPRRYKPTTAMTFPGLRSRKDIDDVIAYITGSQ